MNEKQRRREQKRLEQQGYLAGFFGGQPPTQDQDYFVRMGYFRGKEAREKQEATKTAGTQAEGK